MSRKYQLILILFVFLIFLACFFVVYSDALCSFYHLSRPHAILKTTDEPLDLPIHRGHSSITFCFTSLICLGFVFTQVQLYSSFHRCRLTDSFSLLQAKKNTAILC